MKKLCFLFLCFVSLLGFFGSPAVAYAEGESVAEEYIDAFLASKTYSDAQEYLDGVRSSIGVDAAFMMRRYREGLDFSSVLSAMGELNVGSAATREKRLFYRKAFGQEVMGNKEDVYALGIMSRVFGLHLLKNGVPIDGVDKEPLVAELVSLQNEDGGWALSRGISDVDVTAMCLQALVGEADEQTIEKAVELLSTRQQEDGGFSTMGKSNCESVAQVIIALSALKIDCATDSRFIKNASALDALLSFATENKLFRHEKGADANENATAQAMSALVAYDLFKSGKGAFYSLPEYNFGKTQKTVYKANLPVNAWVAIGIAGASVILCAVLLIFKKGKIKEVVVILLIGCGVSLFVGLSTFQTVDEYYADTEYMGETMEVFVSIRRDTVNKDDPIIFEGNVDVKENATVLDAVVTVTKKQRLQLSYMPGYISSVDSLAEFSYGNESGWMFAVNGEFSNKNCSEKRLKEGDELYLLYTVDMGKDVAGFFEVKSEG